MTIGITGASGKLGHLVVGKLKAKAPTAEIVALARDPAKAADLGVATREADYEKLATLQTALAGVDTLLLISSSEIGKRAGQHMNVILAAEMAGVKRIVYTSLLHADASPVSLAFEHRGTEAALKGSRLAFTILRNGWYTENYTDSIAGALAGGAFLGSAGEGKISAAARADYADAAVAALTDDRHVRRTYELAGDAGFTLDDLAAEISRQSGKTIPYKNLPEDDYASALAGSGLPEEIAKAIAGWHVDASRGALFDDGRQLSKLIGHATTPLSAVVAAALT